MFGNTSKSWKLFSIFGHEVYLTPWFLLLIALFSFSGMHAGAGVQALENVLIWAPVLFGGVLFHEFGHAFALQAYGYGGSRIVLHGFGGVTINERRGHNPPGRSIVISLAGPIASLLLGIAAAGALLIYTGANSVAGAFEGGGLLRSFLESLAFINVLWAAFNMLPINPMDGGHVVLHALRWWLKDPIKAMRYSAISSLVFLGLGVVAVFALGFGGSSLLWIILLAMIFGMQNWRVLQATNGKRQQYPGGY